MNREEVLTRAIAIAKRNGFDISEDFFTEVPTDAWLQEGQDLYFSLIFCRDFAISFFGTELIAIEGDETNIEEVDLLDYDNPAAFLMSNRKNIQLPNWQFHLMQMSFSEDPLEYLHKFIQENEAEFN